MTMQTTEMYFTLDAGQGNGAQTVDPQVEIDGPIVADAKEAVSFNPVGLRRRSNLPGKISAATSNEIRYYPTALNDTLYTDLIASYDDGTEITITAANNATSPSTATNPLLTYKGYINTNPALGGFMDGDKQGANFTFFVSEVSWYDGTTTYTW